MLLQNKWVNENLGFSGEYVLSLTISNLHMSGTNKELYEAYSNKYILKCLFLIQ